MTREIRAVSFDAGFTLLHPDPPVEEVYLREFVRDGARGGPEEMAAALAATWKEVRERRLADRYGGPSGERGFWAVFVERARHHFDGGRLSPESFERLVAHFLEPRSWALYPDVLPALDALAARGLPLAIVSNWDSSLPPLLEAHALSARFAVLVVSAVEKLAKPHPGIFRRAAERLGVDASGVLHVGDSLEEDYEAARAAGLSALLLDRAGRHPDVSDRIASLAEVAARLPASAAPR